MAINQLFKIKPSIDILNKLAFIFGIDLNNLDKKYTFTKKELLEINIETKYDIIKELLKQYYLPCKQKTYLTNLKLQKCITIFRQLLKLYNYSLHSEEKYSNSKKYIIYKIIFNKINNDKIDGIINFD